MLNLLVLAAAALSAAPAAAQGTRQLQEAGRAGPRIESATEAFAEDAGQYAVRHGVTVAEAMRRLLAQEQSVQATDRIRTLYKDRLAGISFEHEPEYRIVVLLTGSDPVPDQSIFAGGMNVPIVFRTGAAATQEQLVEAMIRHRDALRAAMPNAQGMGVDQRTGELVLLVREESAYARGIAALRDELQALTGVPIRIRVLERPDTNLSVDGGARVVGVDPADGRRYACTTGFVVTDGARTGIVTAAHCPDNLTYFDPGGGEVPLEYVNAWGARYQDVQLHVAAQQLDPRFYADTNKTELRTVTGWRPRASTRAGESVCRRGETTGYSCSEIELTDYAPPRELCAGPCDPVWVSVTGPSCRGGDSGGPVFSGTVAFGIVKGGNYDRSGGCNFYYYMSTDFLPEGWRLLYAGATPAVGLPPDPKAAGH